MPGSGDTVANMFALLEGTDLIVVVIVVLVLFGGSQIPKLARNLGQAQKEFKKGIDAAAKSDDEKPAASS